MSVNDPKRKSGPGWSPWGRMSVHGDTAIDACTINAAYAMRQYKTTGSLEVGKRGDLVVLDRDIFSVDADTKVLATYLDGRLVYTAPANVQAKPCRE